MSIGEIRLRKRLENKFGFELGTKAPKWLVSPITGHTLQLDGYNPKKRLAFEYDEQYHFQPSNVEQRVIDAYKDWICAENRVFLIRVSHNNREATIRQKISKGRRRGKLTNEQWNRRAGQFRSNYERRLQEYHEYQQQHRDE